MKPDDWGEAPGFVHGPHPPGDQPPIAADEDSPEFAAIRHIELLARLHHMAFRSLFREDGLPPAQAGAMRVIIRTPGMSQRELADKLHIQRATATVMLQKMEKAGYIDRRPDQDDQRISRIYPTATAITADAENRKNVSAYFSRCFQNIPQQDFDTMVFTLEQVGSNLREILDENPEPIGKE
jgi:DNA-binding MarR family transcriptional regulator